MTHIAIIGFSGRNPSDQQILKSHHFKLMCDKILTHIESQLKLNTENITLVSGGSAWCDHIAVRLAIENNFRGLELYLPCEIDATTGKFISGRESSILNNLHSLFNQTTGIDSSTDFIDVLSNIDTKIVVKKGFLNRNKLIADNCDYLIAFTIDPHFPTSGGTRDTWNKCKNATKIHLSLL